MHPPQDEIFYLQTPKPRGIVIYLFREEGVCPVRLCFRRRRLINTRALTPTFASSVLSTGAATSNRNSSTHEIPQPYAALSKTSPSYISLS